MLNKYLIFLFFIYILLKKSQKGFNNKCDILGFQINGIGNGHITQAKVIYDILIKKYKIPIVIIYGRNEGNRELFPYSKIIYEKMNSTQDSINNMELIKSIKDIISIKNTKNYENKFKINKWFNFWITDFFNYRTKQINISHQLSVPDKRIDLIIYLAKISSNIITVSIGEKSKHTKYYIPPLISRKKINRNDIDKKLILVYSVSGDEFVNTLINIAKKNISYKFKYFTKNKIVINLPKNIQMFKPDRYIFQEFLKRCNGVLCTSGNELILECVYNGIPVATMPCSKKQFEQIYNKQKYVDKLKYAILMNNNLDLDFLVNRDMGKYQMKLKKNLKKLNKKVFELCNI